MRKDGFEVSGPFIVDGVAIFTGSQSPSESLEATDGDYYLQSNGTIWVMLGTWIEKGGGTDHQSCYHNIPSGTDVGIESGKQMIVKHDFKIQAGGNLRISSGGKLCQLN